jgi:hypothetical protein
MTKMNRFDQKTWLLILIVLNLVVSLGHYVHNIVFLPEYHEPGWITPAVIDSLWFVMTPFSGIGYVMFSRGKLPLAYTLLYVYCGLSLLVLGHYWLTPIWTLSPVINAVIFSEAIAAIVLAGYALWLQTRPEDSAAT